MHEKATTIIYLHSSKEYNSAAYRIDPITCEVIGSAELISKINLGNKTELAYLLKEEECYLLIENDLEDKTKRTCCQIDSSGELQPVNINLQS